MKISEILFKGSLLFWELDGNKYWAKLNRNQSSDYNVVVNTFKRMLNSNSPDKKLVEIIASTLSAKDLMEYLSYGETKLTQETTVFKTFPESYNKNRNIKEFFPDRIMSFTERELKPGEDYFNGDFGKETRTIRIILPKGFPVIKDPDSLYLDKDEILINSNNLIKFKNKIQIFDNDTEPVINTQLTNQENNNYDDDEMGMHTQGMKTEEIFYKGCLAFWGYTGYLYWKEVEKTKKSDWYNLYGAFTEFVNIIEGGLDDDESDDLCEYIAKNITVADYNKYVNYGKKPIKTPITLWKSFFKNDVTGIHTVGSLDDIEADRFMSFTSDIIEEGGNYFNNHANHENFTVKVEFPAGFPMVIPEGGYLDRDEILIFSNDFLKWFDRLKVWDNTTGERLYLKSQTPKPKQVIQTP